MNYKPLAERMRPRKLDDYVGQHHLIGRDGVLRKQIERGYISSMIFWGPPGVGKTTLAEIISGEISAPFYRLSAISSGVKDIRDVISKAVEESSGLFASSHRPILFVDEIHRFSKSQQDALLGVVEKGVISLIGATTENPSFEVIRPLISRSQVYRLEPLGDADILELLGRAISQDEVLSQRQIEINEEDALLRFSSGDARRALNILELIVNSSSSEPLVITNDLVSSAIQENPMIFDKGGEMHYDLASALIKSIRGSDPDAAIYYLARLIEGGEDPEFIARRLVISAAEDIGLANPNALLLAEAAASAVSRLGWPEGRIPLAEATIYLATSEKSNSAYLAIDRALERVRETGNQTIPLHIRNAPTALMKDMGYGEGYLYPHDYPGHFVLQSYLPESLKEDRYYNPSLDNQQERTILERQQRRWQNRK